MTRELVGGQALVDGVMIRQGARWSAAARRTDGTIVTTTQTTAPALAPIRSVPLLRGMGALVDSVRIGMAAMRWSRAATFDAATSDAATSDVALPDAALLDASPFCPADSFPGERIRRTEPAAREPVAREREPARAHVPVRERGAASAKAPARERVVVVGVVAAVLAVFLLVPIGVAALSRPFVGTGWGAAVVEGVARLGLFVGYLAMLSRLPGVRRTLEYHGAEHMVVAAYEHGEPPTIAAARDHNVRHPRCGTDFFLLIFAISIVAFASVGHLPAAALVASRIVLAPVVVGVAYEVLRLGGTAHHQGLAAALAAPGLFLQRYTTREPDDGQVEVALAALAALVDPSAGDGQFSNRFDRLDEIQHTEIAR